MSEIPFCKDCQHYSPAEHIDSSLFDICTVHGQAGKLDPVRGVMWIDVHFCDGERDDMPGHCGPEGKLFKRRLTK